MTPVAQSGDESKSNAKEVDMIVSTHALDSLYNPIRILSYTVYIGTSC